jgi:hypothetical protein
MREEGATGGEWRRERKGVMKAIWAQSPTLIRLHFKNLSLNISSSFPTNPLYLSSLNTKHLLPARSRTERIPHNRQLGFRRRRGRCSPGSVQTRPWQRKRYIFSKCKPPTHVFFKPGHCRGPAVSSTASRENHQFVQPCGEVHVYNRYLFPCTRKMKRDEVNAPLSGMTWRTESERANELFAELVQNECQIYFPCRLCLLEILLTGLPSGFTQLRVALIGVIQSRQ